MENLEQKFNHFTDIKILDSSLPTQEELNKGLEAEVVKYIDDAILKCKQAKQNCNGYDLTKKIELVEKADRLEHHDSIRKKPAYRSKIYLGWIKQAHISTTAYLIAMMLSGEWFNLMGKTPEDKKNAEYMSKVIKYLFETNYNFRKVLVQGLYQCVKKGATCIKGFWQIIYSYVYNYEEVFEDKFNPATGQIEKVSQGFKQKKERITQYNDVELEYVDINDFYIWPVSGNFKRVTKIQCTKTKFSELKRQESKYINLDKLEQELGNKNTIEESDIELRECWIHSAYINNREINNVIFTIANAKHVIEVKPFPYDYGIDSFLYTVFEPIEGSLFGKGLCFDATDLQDAANLFINMIADACKIGTYPQTIVPTDTDPTHFASRPGGLIPWPKELFDKGIFPQTLRIDLNNIPLTFETVLHIKKEFEAATVSELLKGIRPQKDETATRDVLVQQGSENKLTIAADNFNEEILKPLLQLIYALYRQRVRLEKTILQSKSEEKPEILLRIAKICLDHTKKQLLPVMDEETDQPKQEPEVDPNTGLQIIDPATNQPIMKTIYEEQDIEKSDEEMLEELGDLVPLERIDISINGYKTNSQKQRRLQNYLTLFEGISSFANQKTIKKIKQDNIVKDLMLTLDLDSDDCVLSDDEYIENEMKEIEETIYLEAYKAIQVAKHPALAQPPVVSNVNGDVPNE